MTGRYDMNAIMITTGCIYTKGVAKAALMMLKRLIFMLILGGVFSGQTLVSANLTIVDRYIDDFSTEMARFDSVDANLFWVDRAYPPKSAYLVYTELNGDSVLAFRGYETEPARTEPARLEYCFPVNPGLVVREASWIIEVQVDVKLTTSRDPTHPVSGYLAYRVSADGVNWSAPKALGQDENELESGLLEENRYIEFIGSNAFLNRLEVTISQPEATLRVGPGQINTIQDAVNLAQNGYRIVVDDGTYSGPGNTNLDFMGKDIVLMSANGPENCIIECAPGDRGVLFTQGETEEAVLDGFTIQAGQAAIGAGIYCESASPTISNCIIKACSTQDGLEPGKGGGIYIESGNPTIKHCVFIDNQAVGRGQGGAIYISSDASAVITKCQFINNSAHEGGAAFVDASNTLAETLMMQNCIFNGNHSETFGGGVSLQRGLSRIVNCTFFNNQAGDAGGAVYIDHSQTDTTIQNSILLRNQPQDIMASPTVSAVGVEVQYNNIDENTFGNTNISLDPGFADADNGDFHLRSNVGRWSGLDGQWIFDQETSPSIDTGNPETPLGAERQPHGETINMGAYGGTAQASLGGGIRVFHVDIGYGSDLNNGLDSTHALASITFAVNMAQDGDYILVWPGVYQEQVEFQYKAITIQSAADAAIVTAPEGYAFAFNSGQGSDSVLRNMILVNCGVGGVYILAASPTIRNLTVVNNPVGINAEENTDPDIKNCIFWNNWDGDVVSTTGVTVHYSVLSSDENDEGRGNLYQNPLFADAVNGDYHLSSQYGRYWPEHGVWILDPVTSPCLDVGEPGIYPVEEPHYNGGRLNIGAHGGTGYASISAPNKPADLNNDGQVDFQDFALFAEAWLGP